MNDCWAAPLGDCAEAISKEHVITGGLFPTSDEVMVQGFPWCMEPKMIGIGRLTAKILCRKHNTDLSPVDAVAIQTFQALGESIRLLNLRTPSKARFPRVIQFTFSGWQLERWFLKTLINIAYKRDYPISSESESPGTVPRRLLEVAFGLAKFRPFAGLYFLGNVGDQLRDENRVSVSTLLDERKVLRGGAFYFRTYRFVLLLDEEGTGNRHFGALGVPRSTKPIYRPAKLRFATSHNRLSHKIRISWMD